MSLLHHYYFSFRRHYCVIITSLLQTGNHVIKIALFLIMHWQKVSTHGRAAVRHPHAALASLCAPAHRLHAAEAAPKPPPTTYLGGPPQLPCCGGSPGKRGSRKRWWGWRKTRGGRQKMYTHMHTSAGPKDHASASLKSAPLASPCHYCMPVM